jgi:circadian clock protein KaiB
MDTNKEKTMPRIKTADRIQEFNKALDGQIVPDRYIFRLYVAGTTSRSLHAIQNTKRICEERLKDRYDLEIIDVYQQAKMALEDQIIAVPTLVKRFPKPARKLIGDLSDERQVLAGLGLRGN